jgi:hypothetical protein
MALRLWTLLVLVLVASALASPASAGVIARGSFKSLNNEPAAGNVAIVKLANGKRVLRFTNSAIGPGPALRIYLVAGTVRGDADVKRFVDLGALKSTTGTQSYAIPRTVDTRRYRTVVVWCADFAVAFGAAALKPA